MTFPYHNTSAAYQKLGTKQVQVYSWHAQTHANIPNAVEENEMSLNLNDRVSSLRKRGSEERWRGTGLDRGGGDQDTVATNAERKGEA